MLRSLVGSEMCIRDRRCPPKERKGCLFARTRLCVVASLREDFITSTKHYARMQLSTMKAVAALAALFLAGAESRAADTTPPTVIAVQPVAPGLVNVVFSAVSYTHLTLPTSDLV